MPVEISCCFATETLRRTVDLQHDPLRGGAAAALTRVFVFGLVHPSRSCISTVIASDKARLNRAIPSFVLSLWYFFVQTAFRKQFATDDLLARSLAFAGGLSVAACLGRSIAALDPVYAAANGLCAHKTGTKR